MSISVKGGEGIHGWGGHGVGLMSILCAGVAWNRMTFFFLDPRIPIETKDKKGMENG